MSSIKQTCNHCYKTFYNKPLKRTGYCASQHNCSARGSVVTRYINRKAKCCKKQHYCVVASQKDFDEYVRRMNCCHGDCKEDVDKENENKFDKENKNDIDKENDFGKEVRENMLPNTKKIGAQPQRTRL